MPFAAFSAQSRNHPLGTTAPTGRGTNAGWPLMAALCATCNFLARTASLGSGVDWANSDTENPSAKNKIDLIIPPPDILSCSPPRHESPQPQPRQWQILMEDYVPAGTSILRPRSESNAGASTSRRLLGHITLANPLDTTPPARFLFL